MMLINSYRFGVAYTARTTAFLAATGITDIVIANALNTMDLALIANGLDTKMQALYPFVGGTASTHKWNFMNALDTDAAFRLTFAGGWTHSSTGALPNGSTGYANTYLKPSVNFASINSYHQSYYSRTNNAGANKIEIGCNQVSSYFQIYLRFSDNNMYGGLMATGYVSAAQTRSDGFYTSCRTGSTAAAIYRNGTSQATSVVPPATLVTHNIYIGAQNNAGATDTYTNRECAFSTIGTGLNSTDNTNLNTLITTFQTSLSRNV